MEKDIKIFLFTFVILLIAIVSFNFNKEINSNAISDITGDIVASSSAQCFVGINNIRVGCSYTNSWDINAQIDKFTIYTTTASTTKMTFVKAIIEIDQGAIKTVSLNQKLGNGDTYVVSLGATYNVKKITLEAEKTEFGGIYAGVKYEVECLTGADCSSEQTCKDGICISKSLIGITCTASSEYSGSSGYYPCTNAIDGDGNTDWATSNMDPWSIEITFPSGKLIKTISVGDRKNLDDHSRIATVSYYFSKTDANPFNSFQLNLANDGTLSAKNIIDYNPIEKVKVEISKEDYAGFHVGLSEIKFDFYKTPCEIDIDCPVGMTCVSGSCVSGSVSGGLPCKTYIDKTNCIKQNDKYKYYTSTCAGLTVNSCGTNANCELLSNKCLPRTKCVWNYVESSANLGHCCNGGWRWDERYGCQETSDLCYSFFAPNNQVPGKSVNYEKKQVCWNIGSVAYGFWVPVGEY